MSRIAMVAGAVVALGIVSGAHAADSKLIDAGAVQNNAAAAATVKAESGSGLALGGGADTQLSSHQDVSALGATNAPSIGSHAYAAMPDEGGMKQGVLNTKVELSSVAADPQIGGKSDAGADAASQGNPLAPAK